MNNKRSRFGPRFFQKTVPLASLGCLLLALGLTLGGDQVQPAAKTAVGKGQVQKKMHRLFVPRDKINLAKVTTVAAKRPQQPPLPMRPAFKPLLNKVRLLRDHWRRIAYVPNVRDRIRQALAIRGERSISQSKTIDEWKQIGLGIHDTDSRYHRGGRIRSMAYAFDNVVGHDVLWVGSSSGALWKSIAGPFGSWKVMSDTLPGSPSVGAFLVHTGDSNRILIGTGDYCRYTGNGLFRTTDGGTTWTNPPLDGNPVVFYRILADSSDPSGDTVLSCGSDGPDGGGIWRSTDFGQTWSRVFVGGVTDLGQDPVSPQFWWAAVPGQGVLESSDGGSTFHLIDGVGGTGLTFPIGRMSITICQAAPNYIYALIERDGMLGGVFRSSNYGYNWTAIDTRDEISWGQGFHTCAIGVHPDDPDKLLVGMGGLQRTDNATAASVTWRRDVDGGHADYTGFLYHPPTDGVLISNDGGCYLYYWSSGRLTGELNLGLGCQQIMAANGYLASDWGGFNLISGLQDNGMILIKPGHDPRLIPRGGGDGGQASVSDESPYTYYFSSGVDYNRYQAGETGGWTGINGSLGTEWAPTVLIDPAGRHKVLTNTNEYVWQKPASGGTWVKVNDGRPFPADFRCKQVDVAPDPDRWVIYATAWNSNRLLVMEGDSLGPLAWEDRTPPAAAGGECLVNAEHWSSDRGTVFYTTATGRPSRAFMSRDYGRNWEDVTGDLRDMLPDASYWKLIRHPEIADRLYLATDVAVFVSMNGGTNWVRFMSGMPQVANVMDMIIVGRATPPPPMVIGVDGIARHGLRVMLPPYGMIIGTYGRGFWVRDLNW